MRARTMHRKLPKGVRKDWLGGARGLAVSPVEETIGLLNGISGEEFATEVPDSDVVEKGGKRKIRKAKRQVKKARQKVKDARGKADARRANKQLKKAQKNFARTKNKVTLTPAEARQVYYKAKAKTDTNELYKIYDDMVETPARALWKEGGATFRWLSQASSYEGRQQIIADLAYMDQLNDESFRAWQDPVKKHNEAVAAFSAVVEQAEVRRANSRQFQLNLMATDPERAIELSAENDSYYEGQVLRGLIAAFAPSPGAKYLNRPISFGGKVLTGAASRSSANLVNAIAQGDQLAGRSIMHGAEDLGDAARFVDDFTFPSADIDELITLDTLGRVGGITKRDQRLAEQINRTVTDELRAKYPDADVEFEMAYRPKKDYEPPNSLAKPQIFQEKTLDPRAVEIMGAPEEGLGKTVLFLPQHPSKFPGWQQLPAAQKASDLDLYEIYLNDWNNFGKANPTGKTALWKPALKKKTKVDFGGGHSVEIKLEKKKLGKNAFEIRTTELRVDDELLHKGKPRSIGADLDPAVAIDSNSGLKLAGEIELDGLETWNREALRFQREFGFRGGGHGAPIHGTDVTPEQWVKFARYGAIHLTAVEQPLFEALVVKRAGLPPGTKILPAGMPSNVHLIRSTSSDTWFGPLGDILE